MKKSKNRRKLNMTSKLGPVTDVSSKEKVEKMEPLTKKVKYPPTGKSDQILQQLHVRRGDGEFCDVQLKYSPSKIVHAHKSILATCSPYFEGMFSSAFLEATSDVVDLSHITDRDDVLENVIDTFYGRMFEINEDNVSETLNLATMLLLDDLKEICAKVLYGLAQVRNASQMLQLAINFDLKDLKEKVQPIIKSRFHDYILLQEELLELNVEGFEFLINNINTKLIGRKAKYIEFLLRWFLVCESDERAYLLKKAIKKVQFKITKRAYIEFKDILEIVNSHLDDENADVSAQMRIKLKQRLLRLKPDASFKATTTLNTVEIDPKSNEDGGKREDSDSELEEEPKRELYNTFGARLKVFGPPTKEKGFTKKEEEEWTKAHEKMAERDQHREWAKQWPLDLLNTLGTHDDPKRPKNINRESPPEFFKSRKRRIKTPEELTENSKLIDALIVLSPSKAYLNNIESKGKNSNDFEDDILDVCAYIPRKHAWYRVTSISASSIKNKFNPSKEQSTSYHRRRSRPDDSDDDDVDDEEAIEMAMMGMYGADMPEMLMMMRGMPSSRRRRLIEQARRGNMPPSMMRRLMEFGRYGDFDDYDEFDDRHRYMMMHHMRRMHRMGPMEMEMLGMSRLRNRAKKVPSLSDPNWNAVYLKHRLYFNHKDIHDSVFCYDILDQEWYRTNLNYENKAKEEDRERYEYDIDVQDGIELIVMGQILYACVRITVFNTRPDRHYRRKEDKIEESKRQEVVVKHAIFKMTGELGNAKWEQVMDNGGHHEFIPIDEEKRLDPDNDRRSLMEYYELGPFLRQPDSLKTLLYAEDEEKLIVCSAVRKHYYKDENIIGFVITNIDMMYIDLQQSSHLLNSPDRTYFQRTVTPLFGDDLVFYFNDDLKPVLLLDLGKPGPWNRMMTLGHSESEKKSEILEALKQYPRCPRLQISARDGESIWVLKGSDNDTSELTEVTITTFYQTKKCVVHNREHSAPPFKCFSLGMTAKLDRTLVKTLSPPTRYLQLD